MYLVRKAGKTYGLLGKILLNLLWGRSKIKKTPSQIEKNLSQIRITLSLCKGGRECQENQGKKAQQIVII